MYTCLEGVRSKQTVLCTQARVTDQVETRKDYSDYLRDCEKIGLRTPRAWKYLSSLRDGQTCSACLFSAYVYLCGSPSYRIQAFSPRTERFIPLKFSLPESTSFALYVYNHLLVVHSANYVFKFAAGQKGQLVQRSKAHFPSKVDKWSNSQPVLDFPCFYVVQSCKCLCFKIKTGELVQQFS